jgi:hypothetical protein
MPLDKRCHAIVHAIGLNAFAEENPVVKFWLEDHGWEFDSYSNKWVFSRHDVEGSVI